MNTAPADPLALDSAIANLCAGPVPQPIDWSTLYRATGCTREGYYANLAHMLRQVGECLIGDRTARQRQDTARRARAHAYANGIRKAPHRETRDEKVAREARAWGWAR